MWATGSGGRWRAVNSGHYASPSPPTVLGCITAKGHRQLLVDSDPAASSNRSGRVIVSPASSSAPQTSPSFLPSLPAPGSLPLFMFFITPTNPSGVFCKSISQCYLHVNSSSQIFTIFAGEETWSRGTMIQPDPPRLNATLQKHSNLSNGSRTSLVHSRT